MVRMSMIEKIARDICWGEFAAPRQVGCTKTVYWRRLSSQKKTEYIGDASKMCWWIKKIDRAIIEKLLNEQAQ